MHSHIRLLPLALAAALLAACSELPLLPAPGEATLRLTVDLASAPVEMLVAEVSASDLEQPLVFNVPISDGRASGTLKLPAGADRQLTLRAFNVAGDETHRGEAMLQVRAGENPAVEITLLPLHGDQPIEGVIGSVVVEVDPPSAEMEEGNTLTLTARVLDGDGQELDRPVHWVTLDPAVVAVDQDGVVTALSAGEGRIAAIHGDVGASARITVFAP
jgi:hypothetical protein